MNKRLMQFLNDLAEENERLEKEIEHTRSHIGALIETNHEHRKTISEMKAKIRKLKKEALE